MFLKSPYFNTLLKVHPFYFISRSNEAFTVLSALSKVLIIKPSQKLICASRDFVWLGWRHKETDAQRKKKHVEERHRTMLRVHVGDRLRGWGPIRLTPNYRNANLKVSVCSLSTIHNNSSLFPKIALQSRLNTDFFDTLIDKRSPPHQHHASFPRGAEKVARDRGFVFFS